MHHVTSSSLSWIKKQGNNCKLIGSWDNFEFRENVQGKRVGDIVKFRSVTMALWILNGWRIPNTGLKQWMWVPTRATVDLFLISEKFLAGADATI